MKSVSSANSWILRSHHRDSPTPEPLTPTYTSPRLAPPPPSFPDSPAKSSFKAGFATVFSRKPPKPPSIHSAYSTSTATSSSETRSLHPYSVVPMGPLPVVSNHSAPDDDDECPVCLEPLSFSFRLPGEKPHIVPECGHALHEVRISDPIRPPISPVCCRPASQPSMDRLRVSRRALSRGKPILACVGSAGAQ